MALQVIGAGFGRTGTLSLKTALELLGFAPCHHMVEVIANPGQLPFWNRVAQGEQIDWDDVYGRYKATVDWPGCQFFAELANFYPDAKVVLSQRDAERWYDSMTRTILPNTAASMAPDHPMHHLARILVEGTFANDLSRENVLATYERHSAEVRRVIPPERLLVFDVAEGWEPLCRFLGVPVPAEPFPRVNDQEEFQTYVQQANDLRLD